jgi:predicted DNA-binding transcriptional regulator AlpA
MTASLPYTPESILDSRELAEYLRMSLSTLLHRIHRRRWEHPLCELPPPFLVSRGGGQGFRWRFSDIQRWIDDRAASFESGVL